MSVASSHASEVNAYKLLIIDEIGYLPLDKERPVVLFLGR